MGAAPTVEELWQRGDLRAATDASAAALELRSQPFRDEAQGGDLNLAQALHDHGTRCWHLARFAEAERVLDRALDLRQSLLGDTHLDTLATRERLAGLANYQLDFEVAEERYRELLDALRGVEGNKGMRLAIARRNYASHLRSRNQLREARESLDAAKKVMRRDAPPLELLALWKADAMLCWAERDDREALDLVEKALMQHVLPDHHPFLAAARLIAARSLVRVDAPKEALELLDVLVPQLERGYGDHPLVAIALHLRSRVASQLKDFTAARAALSRAIDIYRRYYPDALTTRQWIAESGPLLGEA